MKKSIGMLGTLALMMAAAGYGNPYPKEHKGLYEDVAAAGLLIGEYPPGTPNRAEHFPARTRIISGLSLGVAVVEAREHGSGAMITAERALEQDRDVFAVPGNVDAENSRGCIRPAPPTPAAISPCATASSAACPWASWWWRRGSTAAAP